MAEDFVMGERTVEVMEWRNPVYNQVGTINCEVLNERHGWLPFTASPDDTEEAGRLVYADIINSGTVVAEYVAPTMMEMRMYSPNLPQLKMRVALLDAGTDSAKLDEAINTLPNKERVALVWKYAESFARLDPLVTDVLAALGMNDTQIDEFWTKALE